MPIHNTSGCVCLVPFDIDCSRVLWLKVSERLFVACILPQVHVYAISVWPRRPPTPLCPPSQEVVNRPGWRAGGHLVLFLLPRFGRRRTFSVGSRCPPPGPGQAGRSSHYPPGNERLLDSGGRSALGVTAPRGRMLLPWGRWGARVRLARTAA